MDDGTCTFGFSFFFEEMRTFDLSLGLGPCETKQIGYKYTISFQQNWL